MGRSAKFSRFGRSKKERDHIKIVKNSMEDKKEKVKDVKEIEDPVMENLPNRQKTPAALAALSAKEKTKELKPTNEIVDKTLHRPVASIVKKNNVSANKRITVAPGSNHKSTIVKKKVARRVKF